MNCPLCGRFSPDGSIRCSACGADFRDPDVLAIAAAPSRPLTAGPDVEVGGLAQDRLLFLDGKGIADGTSLRTIAWLGGGLILAGALIPLRFSGELRFPLFATDVGPSAALLVPLALALIGLVVAIVPAGRIPPFAIGAALAAAAVVELGFGIAPLGDIAYTSVELPIATWLGIAIGGTGIVLRVLRSSDPIAPWLIVAGAAIYIGGALIPHDEIDALLPYELRQGKGDGSVLGVASDAVGADLAHALLGAILLAPVALLPIAALLAFRKPQDLWDPSGNALRVIGTVIVLGPGIFFLTLALDADNAPPGVFMARTHLALLVSGAMLWLAAGAAAAIAGLRAGSNRTS